MSAPQTTAATAASAAPAAAPKSSVDLDTGKDLTTLDEASLAAELGLSVPDGTTDGESADVEQSILADAAALASGDASGDEPAGEEPNDAATPEPEPEPTQESAATAAKEEPASKPAPLAQFAVFDQEGELEVPELFITFEADGGKKFEKTPLDKVVRLAQQGTYNHRLQQEVASVRETQQRLSQADQRIQQLEATVDQHLAFAERLLTDEEFRETAFTEYERYNSPDAQIARLQAENQRLKTQPTAQPDSTASVQQFFDGSVAPAVGAILADAPTVTQQEVLGQFMLLTAPLLVNGKIPPAQFQRVQEILAAELTPWARQLHEERDGARRERESAAKRAELAKASATIVKRSLARATKPTGRVASDKVAPKPIRDTDDAVSAILADIIARPTT